MFRRIAADNLPAGVGRTIVDHDDLVRRALLRQQRVERTRKIPRVVVVRQHHGKGWACNVRHRRSIGMTTVPAASAFAAMAGNAQKVMGHWIEAGMHHFVVHGENENSVEVTLKGAFQRIAGFAIDMAGLALR